eukprot:TRINITY_DN4074_c0_g1_i1.p1 TRINITY_DN4074_c0_g1~~TRINITY_DN4074_c0_g1_i1.p1  ORF type:complete len:404 (+),score=184.19 TRINITY_DN4074_c0_g1_i1:81-1292(+)
MSSIQEQAPQSGGWGWKVLAGVGALAAGFTAVALGMKYLDSSKKKSGKKKAKSGKKKEVEVVPAKPQPAPAAKKPALSDKKPTVFQKPDIKGAKAPAKTPSHDSKEIEALRQKGNDAFRTGKTKQALEIYNQVLLLDPKNYLTLNNRGMCHAKLQQYSQAIADFTKVTEISPGFGKAYYQRGLLYMGRAMPKEALPDLEKAVSLLPKDKDVAASLEKCKKALEEKNRKLKAQTDKYMGKKPDLPAPLAKLYESASLLEATGASDGDISAHIADIVVGEILHQIVPSRPILPELEEKKEVVEEKKEIAEEKKESSEAQPLPLSDAAPQPLPLSDSSSSSADAGSQPLPLSDSAPAPAPAPAAAPAAPLPLSDPAPAAPLPLSDPAAEKPAGDDWQAVDHNQASQ